MEAKKGIIAAAGIELTDDAKIRVSVFANDKEVRYAQISQKNMANIDRFNPAFFFYSEDVDQNRDSLMLEFYHTFDLKDFSSSTKYNVKLYGIDKNGKLVPGTEEYFCLTSN